MGNFEEENEVMGWDLGYVLLFGLGRAPVYAGLLGGVDTGGRDESVVWRVAYDLPWFFESAMPSESRMLRVPVGEGNCVRVNSVEADSILVCKSSKLTDGRKS